MKYQIKIVKILGDWDRLSYDEKIFSDLEEARDFIVEVLNEENATLLIHFSHENDGVENAG